MTRQDLRSVKTMKKTAKVFKGLTDNHQQIMSV